jgi:hypothetical protein
MFDSDSALGTRSLGSDDYMGSVKLSLTDLANAAGLHHAHNKYTESLQNQPRKVKERKALEKAQDVNGGGNAAKDPLGTVTFTCSFERPTANGDQIGRSLVSAKKQPGKGTKWLTVDVLEAKDLCPVSIKSDHKPLIEVRLGGGVGSKNVQKSRTAINTLAPQWKERFEFQLENNQFSLSFSVYNHSVDLKNAMGKAFLPLHSVVEGEKATLFWLPLNSDEDLGMILVAVTITDSEQPTAPISKELEASTAATLVVKVIKANGLKGKISGKSDPFCVVQVGEQRQRTHIASKTTSPVWNREMRFQIDGIDSSLKLADVKSDIFGHIDLTVYDQDSGSKTQFLGCVRIPILSIVNDEKTHWWALKDQDMMDRVKGDLELKLDLKIDKEWMARFALFGRQPRIVTDRGGKFKPKKLQFTIGRVTTMVMSIVNFIMTVEKCVKFQLGILPGLIAGTVFQYLCHRGKLWMVPVPILMILVWNWLHVQPRSNLLQEVPDQAVRRVYDDDDASEDDPEEDNESEAEPTEKQQTGIRAKVKKVQGILQVVQDKLALVIAVVERIKHLVAGEVPLITLGLAVILILVSIVTYLVEIYLLLSILGVAFFASNFVKMYVIPAITGKKFKKIPKPNKILEILARIPSRSQLQQYRRLAPQTMSIQAARRGNVLTDGKGESADE